MKHHGPCAVGWLGSVTFPGSPCLTGLAASYSIIRRDWKWILAEETELTAGCPCRGHIGFPQSHCGLPSNHYQSSFVSPCAPCHDFLSQASLTEVSEALDQNQPFSLLSFYSRAFRHSNRKSATITEAVDGRLGG